MHSPFQRSASPSFVAAAMCALGGAAASVPLASGFPLATTMISGHPVAVLLIAMLTAALTYATIRVTLKKSASLLFAFAPLAGVGVAVLSLLAIYGAKMLGGEGHVSSLSREASLLAFVVFLAGAVGFTLGLVFAVFYSVPVLVAARQNKRQTVDGGAYTGIASAVWLALVAGAALPFAPAVDAWAIGPLISVTGVIVALVVGAMSTRRLLATRRFVASVRRGEQRGYRIRPLDPHEDLRDLGEAVVFSSTPATWAKVEVLEETALDAQAYRGSVPIFRPAAIVRAAA